MSVRLGGYPATTSWKLKIKPRRCLGATAGTVAQLIDALVEEGLIHLVDVDADPEVLQEEHGELPAQVLAELIQAGEDRSAT